MARTYSWNAYEAKLTSDITDSSTTISVETTIGLQGPGYLVLAPEDPANREYILFATVVDGTTLDLSPLGRGLDGSTAGAQPHDSGTIMRAVSMAQMFDDLWEAILPPNGIEQELQDHIDDPGDPHALAFYLKLDEATPLFVNRSGDSMTGYLTLYADPTADMHPATKRYVDAADPAGKYLLLSGGTMTGSIRLVGNGATALFFDDNETTGFNMQQQVNGDLHVRRGITDWLIFSQTADEVRLNKQLDMDNNEIRNVANPANSGAAMSRGYADARYIAIGSGYTDANAVAAMGTVDNANDLNHDRYTDAEAVAAVGTVDTHVADGGVDTATPSDVSSGTYVKVASFTVAKPSGWGTCKTVVRGVLQLATITGGVNMQLQGYIAIDGSNGPAVQDGTKAPDEDPALSMVSENSSTQTTINIDVYARNSLSNAAAATGKYCDINFSLYRIS